jgi:hypothetical protein
MLVLFPSHGEAFSLPLRTLWGPLFRVAPATARSFIPRKDVRVLYFRAIRQMRVS